MNNKPYPYPSPPAPAIPVQQGVVSATSVDTIAESVRRADREIDKSVARIKQANETIAQETQRINSLINNRNELATDLHKVAPPDYDFREVTMASLGMTAVAPCGGSPPRFQRANPLAFERHLLADTAYAKVGRATAHDEVDFTD